MPKLRILVAEDSLEMRGLYKLALRDELFDRIIVSNGEEALDEYSIRKPDIMLLDIMMPVKSGYQVLKEVRRDFRDFSTVIIMATALKKEEDVKDCLALGIQGYIVKPFNHRTLARKIIGYFEKAEKLTHD